MTSRINDKQDSLAIAKELKVHDNELVGQRRYQLILSLDTACSILSSVLDIVIGHCCSLCGNIYFQAEL